MSKYRFAQTLVFATFVLLFMGGLVTSTDSGLAVPDWPLSYGGLFPPMVGGIRFEHAHRLVASTVGLLTLILTIWIGKTEKRSPIRWLAIACLGAVVLQGILGGLTVLYLLPVPISVAHACLGPLFFSLVVVLAGVLRTDSLDVIDVTNSNVSRVSVGRTPPLLLTVVFFQILLGAVVRHTGGWVWFHVLGAFAVFILTGLLVTRVLSERGGEKQILRPVLFLGFLVTAEFFLGITAFVFTRITTLQPGLAQILFPTLHQTLGSLILATAVVLALRAGRARVGVTP